MFLAALARHLRTSLFLTFVFGLAACGGGGGGGGMTPPVASSPAARMSPSPVARVTPSVQPMSVISSGPNNQLAVTGTIVALLSSGFQLEGGNGIGYFDVY